MSVIEPNAVEPTVFPTPAPEGRRCEDWLRTYMKYTSMSEAPDAFHFWAGVSVIAGALRRKVWLDMASFKWCCNMYIILVAPPGIVSKTTTMDLGMDLLRAVPGVKFGPDVVTWQKFIESMEKAKTAVMVDGQLFTYCAITVDSGELGTFLDPTDKRMVDVMVSLWDARSKSFKKETKTQGENNVPNPWLNLIACTTPDWVSDNFNKYFIGGGFVSRTIFVYAEEKRRLIAYPFLEVMPDELLALKEDLIHDLKRIGEMSGPFTLTPEAIQWGTEWYAEHYGKVRKSGASSTFDARKQTHIHKVAMVLSASRRDSMVITLQDIRDAERLISAVEADMHNVLSRIGQNDQTRATSVLIKIVQSRGSISRQQLFQLVFREIPFGEFEKALHSAVEAGQILYSGEGRGMILTCPKAA
jgi:hypothetical protein